MIFASGSEVEIAIAAKSKLDAAGKPTRVVSVPSMENFAAQDKAYQAKVLGTEAHPFYRWAAAEKPREIPRWNFHKYLIGRDGHVAASIPTGTEPTDPRVIAAIEREFTSGPAAG